VVKRKNVRQKRKKHQTIHSCRRSATHKPPPSDFLKFHS